MDSHLTIEVILGKPWNMVTERFSANGGGRGKVCAHPSSSGIPLPAVAPNNLRRQANRQSRSERSEDARDIRRQGTLGAAPLIKKGFKRA